MNFFFKKAYYKLFDKAKYKEIKYKKNQKRQIDTFKSKLETYLIDVQKKIENNHKLTFKHSGHTGDLIYSLPVVKELSKKHECHFYVNVDKKNHLPYYKHPSKTVLIDERMFNLLRPLLDHQTFLKKVEKFNDQKIDIDLDVFRELPISLSFNSPRWYFHVTGIDANLYENYLEVAPHNEIFDKIIINRTFRYRNQFINYKFLNNYKDIGFIGLKDEYDDLKNEIKNLVYYDCKDFLEMAKILKSSKIHIGNQSLSFAIAEALKVPRILEGCPYFPVVQPIGKNAFNCFFQNHFERKFNYLNNLKLL